MSIDAVLAELDASRTWREETYTHLHAHPELSHREHATAALVAHRLREFGFDVVEGIGGTGVVGALHNGTGPTVAFRADMDGLPLREQTGLPYASTDRGPDRDDVEQPTMHACGHDMHITWLLGAAHALSRHTDAWSGTFLAVFQPAEEVGDGARGMVADGLVEITERPDVVLGMHVMPQRAGRVLTRAGAVMAQADCLHVRIHGRGGHGSMPHTTVDPVVVAAAIVTRLQAVVARELSPFEFGVVTVGSLHAGSKANIIPETAELDVNVRSYEPAVRARLLAAVERIITAECAAAACPAPPDLRYYDQVPLTENDPETIDRVNYALDGFELVESEQITGSEDFSDLPNAWGAPYAFFFVGGTDPALWDEVDGDPARIPSNHSPYFAPAIQPTLDVGTRAAIATTLEWLGRR